MLNSTHAKLIFFFRKIEEHLDDQIGFVCFKMLERYQKVSKKQFLTNPSYTYTVGPTILVKSSYIFYLPI